MNRDFILIIIWVMDMEMRCTESPESLLSGKGAKEECLV